jgi:hypothetical protein
MRHPIQLPNYMGCLMEFYESLTLFYTTDHQWVGIDYREQTVKKGQNSIKKNLNRSERSDLFTRVRTEAIFSLVSTPIDHNVRHTLNIQNSKFKIQNSNNFVLI